MSRTESRHVDADSGIAVLAFAYDDWTVLLDKAERFVGDGCSSRQRELELPVQHAHQSEPHGFLDRVAQSPLQEPGGVLDPFFISHDSHGELSTGHGLIIPIF